MVVRIGLLPMYIELYDEVAPEMRVRIENFLDSVIQKIEKENVTVVTAQICRLEKEFKNAVASFEKSNVDAIVTLHLAYSPSLESIEALVNTSLPIIVLDTTEDFDFGPAQVADAILFNHGIHGVQDMCSLLVRHNKDFHIEAGHWKESNVIKRVVDQLRALVAAKSFKKSRIGLIGTPFEGMGDFQLSNGKFEEVLGITTVTLSAKESEHGPRTVAQELDYLKTVGDICGSISDETLKENVLALQQIRNWMVKENLDGFTCNFLDFTKKGELNRVPFLAAAVGMFEQYGYAGEGDVLNAALVGSFLKINPNTTFTEMFCPDWRGETIFLSHMGELNPRICNPKAKFISKEYGYSDAYEPIYATGQYMHGSAHLINVVILANNKFRLIVAPTDVLSFDKENFENSVRGWIKPRLPLSQFLQEYSQAGGTHHSALVYGESDNFFKAFAHYLGWEFVQIG
jgi:L-arabinose isomerase